MSAGDDARDDPALAQTALADTALGETALGETAALGDGPPPPAPPKTFGRYELVEPLGEGAMGIVWRAKDDELKRQVAIKVLRRRDSSLAQRLVREARSMAQVNHPNVVAVYEGGVFDGQSFLAMELVEGQSLRAWQDRVSHTVPEVIAAYVAAGRGLAAAHAAGIVHRDFKPENVLVGRDGRVRVTDFGLAAERPGEHLEPDATADLALTRAGALLGTPAYMAPEQFAAGNTDSRTDQFSFCASLYEALYGERAFDGRTFAELASNVSEGRMRPPPAARGVSRQLRAILLRGLATRPGDRFPTMDHLLAQLARDRAAPWRRTAAVAAVLAGVLVAGLGFDAVVRARSQRSSAQTFVQTGLQADRVVALDSKAFDALFEFARIWPPTRDVTANPDLADFGLSSPEQDGQEMQRLHDELASADWSSVRRFDRNDVAIVDAKGRVLYSSAAPASWQGVLSNVPIVRAALAAPDASLMAVMPYDDPELSKVHLFGPSPPHRLAVVFAHTLDNGDEPGGAFIQFVRDKELLDSIRLDDRTQLSLVAPDGTSIGNVPPRIVARALAASEITTLDDHGELDLVQARPILDAERHRVGAVVMAAQITTLLPHARQLLAVSLCAALAVLGVALSRARRIATTRV